MTRPYQLAVALTVALVLAVTPAHSSPKQKAFNGRWWMSANPDERAGFINGFSDCAVWTAHDNSFNATPEQVANRITDHYHSRKASLEQFVPDVWKDLVNPELSKSVLSGGETWSNPHWYLNSGWWRGERQPTHTGYVEGYLVCLKTLLPHDSEKYSGSMNYYSKQIDTYVAAHKNSDQIAIATILQHFRDRN